MKVYVLVELSHGEVPCSLDNTQIFATKESAEKALKKAYQKIIDMVDGYDLLENNLDADGYYVEIDDDDLTHYFGTIMERRVK